MPVEPKSQVNEPIQMPEPTDGILYKFKRGIWHILALVGLFFSISIVYVYQQGQQALQHFEPGFLSMAGKFVEHAIRTDVASALVIKIPVESSVSYEDAVESMKSRAEALNIPLIAHYKMHEAVEKKTGESVRITEILEFCNVETAYRILEHNMDYLAHMPCRVALHEDLTGKLWMLTMNLNLLIHGSKGMNPEMKIKALSIQDALLEIMAAGASGKL